MPSEPVALLFMPPWEPIRLRPDKTVVIGRSPSCDLPVPSSRVSRRHAWVHRDGSRYAVSDLGSTNGTYVNQQLVIGARVLAPGDKIGVGDHVVTFCVMEPSAGSATVSDETDSTLVFSGNPLQPSIDALQGELTQIPTYALLQMLEIGQKTGVLDIAGSPHRARLWLANGRPVHAEVGDRRGFDAALDIARMQKGRFTFEPAGSCPATTIQQSMPELLLEASRQLDESRR